MGDPLVRALAAEIQAVAIYEAEVFLIRRPVRRALLQEILNEERSHARVFSQQVRIAPLHQFALQASGWIAGMTLSLLPWRVLCRFQSWAEDQAAAIYDDAARVPGLEPDGVRAFIEAAAQEREHARRFRA